MLTKLNEKIQANPVRFYFLVQTILTTLITFGLGLAVDQVGAILALTNIVLWILTDKAVVPIAVHEEAVEKALNTPVPVAD